MTVNPTVVAQLNNGELVRSVIFDLVGEILSSEQIDFIFGTIYSATMLLLYTCV